MELRRAVEASGLDWSTVATATAVGFSAGRRFHLRRTCANAEAARPGRPAARVSGTAAALRDLAGGGACLRCASPPEVLRAATWLGVRVWPVVEVARQCRDLLATLAGGVVPGDEGYAAVAVDVVRTLAVPRRQLDPNFGAAVVRCDELEDQLSFLRTARSGSLVLWGLRARYAAQFRRAPVPPSVLVSGRAADEEFARWAGTDPARYAPASGLHELVAHWGRSCGAPSGRRCLVWAQPASRGADGGSGLLHAVMGVHGGVELLDEEVAVLVEEHCHGHGWSVAVQGCAEPLALEVARGLYATGSGGAHMLRAACAAVEGLSSGISQ